MKKILIVSIIIVVLAGTAFMFGWVQFSVPPGKYGVISSKTHGLDSKLVRSGEFRWLWYKLIPTNVKITIFHLEQSKFPIHFSSSLPSGNNYASFAGYPNPDFSWNLEGEISFGINPEMLITLISGQNFTNQESLNTYLQTIAKDIEVIILRILSSAGDDITRLERILDGNRDMEMEREVKNKYPEINDFSISIHSAKYPNFILYRESRELYEEFLLSQREYLTSTFGARTEYHMEIQRHFNELERYGELLTKYPILLDYLALNRNQ